MASMKETDRMSEQNASNAGEPIRETVEQTAFECQVSAAQERFWILEKLQPGNPALNVAVRWRIEGRLIADLAEQAFRQLIDRHEALRTAVLEHEGALIQRVMPSVAFKLAVVDLLALPTNERESMAMSLGAREAATPFALDGAPLLRATLLRLSETRSIMLVTAHHIVCDGWSIGIMARDFGETYAALRADRPANLPALPIQYADFTLWRAETETQEDVSASVAYWTRQLTGMKHFEVQPDLPRPPVQSSNGAILGMMLPRELTDPLSEFSRTRGVTLFTTALSAMLVLLNRYTGETDIGLGTQIAGRTQEELADLVGLFINTVVLRNDVSGDPSFNDLVARSGEVVTQALAHQNVPIETVIQAVKPQRDLSRNALFSVNFIFQRSFVHNARYGDIELVDIPSQSAGALYDLNFFMVERPEGWRFACEYNTDLFLAETVRTLLDGFATLLAGVLARPGEKLSALPVIDAATRRRLLIDWNDTKREYPSTATVLDLFDMQAKMNPTATAVQSAEGAISYRDLHAASDRLSQRLVRRGVGVGDLVGLCCDRSGEMVVAMLAILKAGAAYVPLDPGYPAARLMHAVEDSGLTLILTQGEYRTLFDGCGVGIMIQADATHDGPARAAPIGKPASLAPDNLAYVIYTSGSTGKPKGVQIQHQALVNLLWAMREQPGLGAKDTLLSVTSLSFDIAALEIFLPLITGAKLVIATRMQAADGVALQGLLAANKATVMQATPATWHMLLETGWTSSPGFRMLCGGEALPRRLANALVAGGGELWNMYGPTETTIWSSAIRVHHAETPVPVGAPIANTQFHVLDEKGGLSMAGARGELYIGGDGLALGYRGNEKLTGERFVKHPLATTPDGRLYRTGDVVRRRFDGTFEFLGRADFQVKLRGFRIELGDIESAISLHPQVKECVALVRADAAGENHLFAYVVPVAPGQVGSAELVASVNRLLAGSLPAYMIPSLIVSIDAFPLTPNGKVDRNALPTPERRVVATTTARQAANEAENRVLAIWKDVLKLDSIDLDANFFDLGGHSLLAAKMLARLGEMMGHPVSLTALFQAPTVRELARLIPAPERRNNTTDPQIVVVQPNGHKTPVFAINNTSIFHHLSRHLGQDRPFIAVQAFDADLEDGHLGHGFAEIASAYVRAIRSMRPQGPYILLGLCVAGSLAYEVAQQLRAEGEEISLLVMVDAWAPGYTRKMSRLRRLLANVSYIGQRTLYHITHLHQKSPRALAAFYWERPGVLRLRMKFARSRHKPGAEVATPAFANKDWAFLEELERAAKVYEPKPYDGRVVLFYRPDQPSGAFLDRNFGWTGLAVGGIETLEVPGDHLGMFRDPGASIMARHIQSVLG